MSRQEVHIIGLGANDVDETGFPFRIRVFRTCGLDLTRQIDTDEEFLRSFVRAKNAVARLWGIDVDRMRVDFDLQQIRTNRRIAEINGPSAGLAFALAIAQLVTPEAKASLPNESELWELADELEEVSLDKLAATGEIGEECSKEDTGIKAIEALHGKIGQAINHLGSNPKYKHANGEESGMSILDTVIIPSAQEEYTPKDQRWFQLFGAMRDTAKEIDEDDCTGHKMVRTLKDAIECAIQAYHMPAIRYLKSIANMVVDK